MIPKVIHYCWLSGDPFPEKMQHCIDSWHRVLPDYEFVLWDTSRFPLAQSDWVREAFERRRYAFAADYIRLYALYHHGGIYLDCDVEVLKSFDPLLHLPYFVGNEAFEGRVEMAAFGAEAGCRWVGECLKHYEGRHFVGPDGAEDITVAPEVVKQRLADAGIEWHQATSIAQFDPSPSRLSVFPRDWFCAHVHLTDYDVKPTYIISPHTYCVHHFANSWVRVPALKRLLWRLLDATRLADLYVWLRQLPLQKKQK